MNAAAQSPTPQPPSTPGSLGIGSARALMRVDLDQQPFVVAWEITRACAPACRHCRAEAQPRRHPDELFHVKGKALIDQIADMGTPLLILTGHGLLESPAVVKALIGREPDRTLDQTFDRLADAIEQHCDTEFIHALLEAT